MATPQQLIEELLAARHDVIGEDYDGYRNHCLRVFTFCAKLANADEAEQEKLAIAVAFHDLGIWTDNTLDYLGPSEKLAREHLTAIGRDDWAEEVTAIIGNHHKITPYRQEPARLVDCFRQADLVDVSLGAVTFGLPNAFIKEVQATYPNEGFHKSLARIAMQQMRKYPLRNPLKMMKL